MNLRKLQITALIACAAFVLLSAPRVHAATPGLQPQGFGQDRDDWQRPPDAWNDVQRRGFHDGIEGAHRDVDNHRRPDVNNRDEYRNPDVPREMRRAYREAFRRGYNVAMSHMMNGPMNGPPNGPPMQMRAPIRAWNVPPDEFDALRRQGFQDGIEGARKDYENHRRPDVENREEYRRPHLPPEQREAYRAGFRRGYQVGIDHVMGRDDRDRR
jgi:hypothetical protein